jgi:uncharacterized protein YegL
MGWAKYQEDNVSRFWRDAHDQHQTIDHRTAVPDRNSPSDDPLETLRALRAQLALTPSNANVTRRFNAEKIRLGKLGVSPGDINDVIHGNSHTAPAGTPTIQPKPIAPECNVSKGSEMIQYLNSDAIGSSETTKRGIQMKEFTVAAAKPLPVIVLADVSGSMGEAGKITALNAAIADMIRTFAHESRVRAEIQVGIIAFGDKTASFVLPLTSVGKIADIPTLVVTPGNTPMGQAFALARQTIEDKEAIPSRAYRPVLILVSDGQPNDEWELPFEELCKSERCQKTSRYALAIGNDADEEMLRKFANNPEAPLFMTHEASDIHRFFRAVTMSVTTRTAGTDPNLFAPLSFDSLPDDDDLDLNFK